MKFEVCPIPRTLIDVLLEDLLLLDNLHHDQGGLFDLDASPMDLVQVNCRLGVLHNFSEGQDTLDTSRMMVKSTVLDTPSLPFILYNLLLA